MDTDQELNAAKARLAATIERNQDLTGKIAISSAEPSRAFATELWRGLLAVNGAGLAASATILSVEGFPSLYLKLASVFFFIGLATSIFSWATGLGFPYWASQLAANGKTVSGELVLWLDKMNAAKSKADYHVSFLHLKQINRRQQILIAVQGLLLWAFARVALAAAAAAMSFGLGSTSLIVGVLLYKTPIPAGAQVTLPPISDQTRPGPPSQK